MKGAVPLRRDAHGPDHPTILARGTPERCRRWPAPWRLVALLVLPMAVAAAFQLQPTYVILDIPVTRGPTGYFWWEEQRSELAYEDSWGVLYLRRKVGSTSPAIHGWQTTEEVLAYFDRWLTSNGWMYTGLSIDSDPTLPESRFLQPEQRRHYHRSDDPYIQATVAVWPTGAASDILNVVLTTARPSWARRLWNEFD